MDAERTPLTIEGDFALEGMIETPRSGGVRGGVVVAHPHPLHGATMQNPVVYHAARGCREAGLATLRFNFRGVEGSEGTYSGLDEFRDVQAAWEGLRSHLGRDVPIGLAGYSFGAVMSALAVREGTPAFALGLIALAVRWEQFNQRFLRGLEGFRGPVFALCGEKDDIAPEDEVRSVLQSVRLDPDVVVLPGADHFFAGRQEEIREALRGFFSRAVPYEPLSDESPEQSG